MATGDHYFGTTSTGTIAVDGNSYVYNTDTDNLNIWTETGTTSGPVYVTPPVTSPVSTGTWTTNITYEQTKSIMEIKVHESVMADIKAGDNIKGVGCISSVDKSGKEEVVIKIELDKVIDPEEMRKLLDAKIKSKLMAVEEAIIKKVTDKKNSLEYEFEL
jgi:hypothetical protein